MLKNKIKYFAFVLLMLAWTGCGDKIGGEDDKPIHKEDVVYLTVNARAAHTAGEESVNTDGEDFEDHVHSLAMLVFDTASGSKIAEYYTTNITAGEASYVFTAELTPGQRDFYFVSNLLPGMKESFEALTGRSEMNAQMNLLRDLKTEHYMGATDKNGFPMARVYLNQAVTEGGSIYQPVPFRPVVNGVAEDNVKLVRVVAKLEVIFDDTDVNNVIKVELVNANKQFSLVEVGTEPAQYVSDIVIKKLTGKNNWLAYMPEAFVASGKWWDNTGTPDNRPINYFRITAVGGIVYNIPIITHDGAIPGGKYLPFAEGKLDNKPVYTVYRNHHYKYEIKNLPNQIEIIYSISNWNVVQKETYMGYGYNVEVDNDGNITVSNTMQNCDPHTVRLRAVNGAYFGNDTSNTLVEFTQLGDGVSQTYRVNKDNVNTGEVYLEVYYNKTPGAAGVTPDKVFTKK